MSDTSKSLIDKIAEENPDLTYEFIKGILIGLQEIETGQTEPYSFDEE